METMTQTSTHTHTHNDSTKYERISVNSNTTTTTQQQRQQNANEVSYILSPCNLHSHRTESSLNGVILGSASVVCYCSTIRTIREECFDSLVITINARTHKRSPSILHVCCFNICTVFQKNLDDFLMPELGSSVQRRPTGLNEKKENLSEKEICRQTKYISKTYRVDSLNGSTFLK